MSRAKHISQHRNLFWTVRVICPTSGLATSSVLEEKKMQLIFGQAQTVPAKPSVSNV